MSRKLLYTVAILVLGLISLVFILTEDREYLRWLIKQARRKRIEVDI
jgi:hypothetical protein